MFVAICFKDRPPFTSFMKTMVEGWKMLKIDQKDQHYVQIYDRVHGFAPFNYGSRHWVEAQRVQYLQSLLAIDLSGYKQGCAATMEPAITYLVISFGSTIMTGGAQAEVPELAA